MRTSATPIQHPEFAARLKSARLRTGKSQEQMALEVGTSRRHWIRWEKGYILPSTPFIARICEATGQTPEALSGVKITSTAESDDDSEAEPVVADVLLRVFRQIVRDELRAAAA